MINIFISTNYKLLGKKTIKKNYQSSIIINLLGIVYSAINKFCLFNNLKSCFTLDYIQNSCISAKYSKVQQKINAKRKFINSANFGAI